MKTECWKSLVLHTGQLIAYELVHASQARCPVELVNIPVPKDDPDFSSSTYGSEMPFVRSGYNKKTGQSPNSPRKPVSLTRFATVHG